PLCLVALRSLRCALPISLPAEGEEEACEALTGDFTDQIVLVSRGTCAFYDKAVNVQDTGAAGVVLYNNEPGLINPTVEGEGEITERKSTRLNSSHGARS